MSFKTIGIIVKPHTELVKDKLEHLLAYLKQKDCEVLLDESIEAWLTAKILWLVMFWVAAAI